MSETRTADVAESIMVDLRGYLAFPAEHMVSIIEAALTAAEERGRKAGRVEGLEAAAGLADTAAETYERIDPVRNRLARMACRSLADQYRSIASSVQPSPTADAQGSADQGLGADGWNFDMEAAPRNESVLIYIPNADHYGPPIYRGMLVDMGTGKRWSANGLHFGRDCGTENQPTAWMPLPAPPAVSEPSTATGGE